ncbi:hypothetical protein [Burkholderia oklahomensis]|uniref:hypothetical protein n=2 Tax=Burkholderia oklahomensis TaxID=342113 RepID=UPI000856520F|nr:hypothetical protein [Burkholderia oklahomensis]AOI48910.1 hypothetical protein WI23_24165 [Burkholderia oklahomensis C6786]MBI0362881.1 hypothetical protein [Burkholderia oklahomensis]
MMQQCLRSIQQGSGAKLKPPAMPLEFRPCGTPASIVRPGTTVDDGVQRAAASLFFFESAGEASAGAVIRDPRASRR